MYIEELTKSESGAEDEESLRDVGSTEVVLLNAKRALIVVGARILFYPTLLYNIVRNKIEPEFRWWDLVDEFILLGAVPFPTDVPRLRQLGVEGVITLNEPYETLVPTALYLANGIDHLVIPTRDYLFAPSFGDICQAVGFIHRNASRGRMTYVHCKAGRGRSTTIVLCYLVQHKGMTPNAAYEYVKFSRPRVRLASVQWQAVQDYYRVMVKRACRSGPMEVVVLKTPAIVAAPDAMVFDDSSFVVVTRSDLDGYNGSFESGIARSGVWAELSLVCRVQFAGQATLARFSCLWLRCHARQKISSEKLRKESCSVKADQLGSLGVDIPVY